jgi:hypothetical protein
MAGLVPDISAGEEAAFPIALLRALRFGGPCDALRSFSEAGRWQVQGLP